MDVVEKDFDRASFNVSELLSTADDDKDANLTTRLRGLPQVILSWLWSFYGFRVIGFVVFCFLFAIAFYGIENVYGTNLTPTIVIVNGTNTSATQIPGLTAQLQGLNFIDALFISVSIISATGLETIDFSQWTLASQIIASE